MQHERLPKGAAAAPAAPTKIGLFHDQADLPQELHAAKQARGSIFPSDQSETSSETNKQVTLHCCCCSAAVTKGQAAIHS